MAGPRKGLWGKETRICTGPLRGFQGKENGGGERVLKGREPRRVLNKVSGGRGRRTWGILRSLARGWGWGWGAFSEGPGRRGLRWQNPAKAAKGCVGRVS